MKYIISGTNRVGSRTLEIAKLVQGIYKELGEEVELIDLSAIALQSGPVQSYTGPHPSELQKVIDKINAADGLIIICPEYNGSYPGVLKYFIDHWSFPESFEHRPVCFVGLGGRFGGLRPIEHLQQVFGYRNSYIFPQRVFLVNVWNTFKDGKLTDEAALQLLKQQAANFQRFVRGLSSEKLDSTSMRALVTKK